MFPRDPSLPLNGAGDPEPPDETASVIGGAFLATERLPDGSADAINVRLHLRFGPEAGCEILPLAGAGAARVADGDPAVKRHYERVRFELRRMAHANRKIVPVPKPASAKEGGRVREPGPDDEVSCPVCGGEAPEERCELCGGDGWVRYAVARRMGGRYGRA